MLNFTAPAGVAPLNAQVAKVSCCILKAATSNMWSPRCRYPREMCILTLLTFSVCFLVASSFCFSSFLLSIYFVYVLLINVFLYVSHNIYRRRQYRRFGFQTFRTLTYSYPGVSYLGITLTTTLTPSANTNT